MTVVPHARASIAYLLACTDPGRSSIPYFMGFWHQDGMELRHSPWDIVENTGRAAYSLDLNQVMTGDTAEPAEAAAWKRHLAGVWDPSLLLYAVPDGLSFLPTDPAAQESLGVFRSNDFAVASLWENKAVYLGLTGGGLLYGDQERIDMGRRILQGVRKWIVRDPARGWAYATHPHLSRESGLEPGAPPVPGQEMSGLIQMLALDWMRFQDQGSLDLAVEIAACMLALVPEPGVRWPRYHNVHSFLFFLSGLALLYRVTAEKSFLDYAARWFDWVTRRLATTWGWVSEFPPEDIHPYGSCRKARGDRHTGEVCATSDAIATAVHLAKALGGKLADRYWSIAERFARNHMAETQVRDPAAFPVGTVGEESRQASFRDVPARLVGSYGGWTAPNAIVDFRGRNRRRVFQSCCATHAAWGLHAAWDSALLAENGVISANLHVDRETGFARARYTEPSGEACIDVYRDAEVRIRLPEGIDPGSLEAAVDGRVVPARAFAAGVRDGFVHLGRVKAGSRAVLRSRAPERRETERVELREEVYDAVWVGETLLSLSPPGENLPTFVRRTWGQPDPGPARSRTHDSRRQRHGRQLLPW